MPFVISKRNPQTVTAREERTIEARTSAANGMPPERGTSYALRPQKVLKIQSFLTGSAQEGRNPTI